MTTVNPMDVCQSGRGTLRKRQLAATHCHQRRWRQSWRFWQLNRVRRQDAIVGMELVEAAGCPVATRRADASVPWVAGQVVFRIMPETARRTFTTDLKTEFRKMRQAVAMPSEACFAFRVGKCRVGNAEEREMARRPC